MKKYYKDIILIVILLAFSVGIFLRYSFFNKKGEKVKIYELVEQLDLKKNQTKKLETKYGTNVIKIKDEEVIVESASCNNQVCVNHKAISNTGESIICIPNRLVVSIEGNSNENGVVDDIAK